MRETPPPERSWSGDSAGWNGLCCARRTRASSSASGDRAMGGSARTWDSEAVSGGAVAVQSRRMEAARAMDTPPAGRGGGMAGGGEASRVESGDWRTMDLHRW